MTRGERNRSDSHVAREGQGWELSSLELELQEPNVGVGKQTPVLFQPEQEAFFTELLFQPLTDRDEDVAQTQNPCPHPEDPVFILSTVNTNTQGGTKETRALSDNTKILIGGSVQTVHDLGNHGACTATTKHFLELSVVSSHQQPRYHVCWVLFTVGK